MEVEGDIDELPRNAANFNALTPLWFLERAALIHPQRRSVVRGCSHYTWLQTYQRRRRMAYVLSKNSVGAGSTLVAVIAPNVPAIYEAHFGVPMAGAVLTCANIRLKSPLWIVIGDKSCDPAELKHALDKGAIEYKEISETGDTDFAWKPPKDEWQSIALGYTYGTTSSPNGVV